MEGNSMPVSGIWRFVPAAAGWGLRAKFEGNVEGMGRMEEDDLFGFDAETGKTHIYSLTNTGNVHDHVGGWTGADSLEFVCATTQDGKPYREVIVCAFRGSEVAVTITEWVEGQQTAVFAATFRK